jgi:hypothetical protein
MPDRCGRKQVSSTHCTNRFFTLALYASSGFPSSERVARAPPHALVDQVCCSPVRMGCRCHTHRRPLPARPGSTSGSDQRRDAAKPRLTGRMPFAHSRSRCRPNLNAISVTLQDCGGNSSRRADILEGDGAQTLDSARRGVRRGLRAGGARGVSGLVSIARRGNCRLGLGAASSFAPGGSDLGDAGGARPPSQQRNATSAVRGRRSGTAASL